jgi:hypothetical protein
MIIDITESQHLQHEQPAHPHPNGHVHELLGRIGNRREQLCSPAV